MEGEQQYTTPEKLLPVNDAQNVKKRLAIIIGTGVVLILGALMYYIYVSTMATPVIEEVVSVTPKRVFNPEGTIYLTLAPKDGNHVGIYAYDIRNNALTPFYTQENGTALTGKFAAGATSALLISEYLKNESIQIVGVEPDTKNRVVLTDTKSAMKRHPSWSIPYKMLVYAGKGTTSRDIGNPDEFNIYTYTKVDKEKKLTKGTLPSLTGDGKSVIVLRSDGLHKIALRGTSTEKIWGFDTGSGWSNQMYSVSPKGKYIAWTHPDSGKIHIMEVSSWEPFVGKVRFTIETHAFWPIFSENEEYLAYEEVDWTNPPTKPRIVIMDMLSLERKTVYDLDVFDQMQMFMSDWK